MKTSLLSLLLLSFGIGFAASSGRAQDTNVTSTVPARITNTRLPYGVEDVLKLSRAQVGEDVILNYVQSSGTIYNLGSQDIVFLKEQGVSDRVVNAMLDQRKRVVAAAPSAAPQAAPAPAIPDAQVVQNAPTVPNATAVGPNPTYAEAPLTPPASSVYVIPYAPTYYAPYPYYYGGYYYGGGWCGPSISLGFRFGGHGGWHGHRR